MRIVGFIRPLRYLIKNGYPATTIKKLLQKQNNNSTMIFTELMVMPDEKLISWLKDPENQAFARFSLVTELKNAIKENSYDLANTFVRVDSEILKFFANDLRSFS